VPAPTVRLSATVEATVIALTTAFPPATAVLSATATPAVIATTTTLGAADAGELNLRDIDISVGAARVSASVGALRE
jgi:hypothetical protein